MLIKKVSYLLLLVLVGCLFTFLNVPAGWLVGALLTGICVKLFVDDLAFSDTSFYIALALAGVNIGLIIDFSFFKTIYPFLIPLGLTLFLTISCYTMLGFLLHRYSGLDKRTAFFCCIPGGASEAIAVSKEYGANQPIVAAFHSTRIIMFVLMVPLFVGLVKHIEIPRKVVTDYFVISIYEIFCIMIITIGAMIFTKLFKIPAGSLLYGMILGFVLNQLVFQIETSPPFLTAFGQILLGGVIGLKFTKTTLITLRKVGIYGLAVLICMFIFSFSIAFVFSLLANVDYITSLLSTVPAGAGEMALTAFVLHLEASLIATLQIARLITVFLIMPIMANRLLKERLENSKLLKM